MHVAGVLLTVTSVYSSIHIGTGFLNVGALVTLVGGLYPPLLAPGTSGLKPSFHEGGWTSAKFPRSLRREATAEAASEASPSGEVRLTFKPSDVQVGIWVLISAVFVVLHVVSFHIWVGITSQQHETPCRLDGTCARVDTNASPVSIRVGDAANDGSTD